MLHLFPLQRSSPWATAARPAWLRLFGAHLELSPRHGGSCHLPCSRVKVECGQHVGVGTAGELQAATHTLIKDSSTGGEQNYRLLAIKASCFRSGSQNPWARLGKRRGDKAKCYLLSVSYIYPSFFFFSSSFWKSHL